MIRPLLPHSLLLEEIFMNPGKVSRPAQDILASRVQETVDEREHGIVDLQTDNTGATVAQISELHCVVLDIGHAVLHASLDVHYCHSGIIFFVL